MPASCPMLVMNDEPGHVGAVQSSVVRYPGFMAAPRTQLAAFADLQALPEEARAEIIHGIIVEKASPSAEHGGSQFAFSSILGRRFQRQPGGRWPGGWWFGTEIGVEYEAHEVYRHD